MHTFKIMHNCTCTRICKFLIALTNDHESRFEKFLLEVYLLRCTHAQNYSPFWCTYELMLCFVYFGASFSGSLCDIRWALECHLNTGSVGRAATFRWIKRYSNTITNENVNILPSRSQEIHPLVGFNKRGSRGHYLYLQQRYYTPYECSCVQGNLYILGKPLLSCYP